MSIAYRFTARRIGSGPGLRGRLRAALALAWLWAVPLAWPAGSALAAGPEPEAMETGRALFLNTVPACAICHTLADAGATGAIGPVLDELQPDASRVEQAIRSGIGQMPAYTSLTDEDIAALAAYVAKASGGAP